MDDNCSNQNNNVFSENCCIKCRDLKSGQEELSVVTRGLDKLIQYSDFIQDERLRLYLSDSEKNGVTVKIHRACHKTITNDMKCKGGTVPTTSKKSRRVRRSDLAESRWKTHCFYCGSPCVPNRKHPEHKRIGNVWILPSKQSVLKTCDQGNDKWAY